MKKFYIYDIECMANFHSAIFRDPYSEEKLEFVIHKERDDFISYINFLNKCIKDKIVFIGFNNIAYDGQVIETILLEQNKLLKLSSEARAQEIYRISNWVINTSRETGWAPIPEWRLSIFQIDLYKIWHFDNKQKKMSLKAIEFVLRMGNIEDMPIHHSKKIYDNEEIHTILSYNNHDVLATYLLYLLTIGDTDTLSKYIPNHKLDFYKGKNKLQLRRDIQIELGINCVNFNDVKIGDEINKRTYMKNTGLSFKEIKERTPVVYPFTFGDCIPDYVSFKTPELQKFYDHVRVAPVDLKKNKDDDSQVFQITFRGTEYTIAKGGIHSCEGPRMIIPNENQYLRDADVGSQYPNAIKKRRLFPKHLGEEWLIGYTSNIEKKDLAKQTFKSTKEVKEKSKEEVYKLALNGGGFGKTNESSNWQYSPVSHFSCTIGNQFEILMLIEDMELNNIHVVSANTDGIVCLFDKSLSDLYYQICSNWENKVGNNQMGKLEYAEYSKLIQTSVNDYMAIKPNGEVKLKGDFESDKEVHKNHSMRIVPYSIQKYFLEGTPVEKTIEECTDIYEFCKLCKLTGENTLITRIINKDGVAETNLSKTTRYYVSNKGVSLIKVLPPLAKKIDQLSKLRATSPNQLDIFSMVEDHTLKPKDRETNIEAGWLCTVFNKYEQKSMKDYDINYDYYINECNKIIKTIEHNESNRTSKW